MVGNGAVNRENTHRQALFRIAPSPGFRSDRIKGPTLLPRQRRRIWGPEKQDESQCYGQVQKPLQAVDSELFGRDMAGVSWGL